MKNVILLLSVILSCTGCTYEGPHSGCDGSLSLVFTHEGNTADFDRLVASDIELYIYDSEGRQTEKIHIPYESIEGGKAYPLERQYTGDMHLVAWTLSGDEDTDKISPAFVGEENYSTAGFSMGEQSARQFPTSNGSMQELFLESLSFTANPLENRVLNVDVKKQLCSIFVIIKEGKNFKTQYPGELSVNIRGSSASYKVAEGKQSGDRIIIEDVFSYVQSTDEYIAENKVMPASVDSETKLEDNITVTLLEDGIARLSVDTGTKAQRGAQVYVIIQPTKLEAIITTGSWQVRRTLVAL